MSRLEEYVYRTHFHLSKEQMANEPLEDIVVNMKLMHLAAKKENQETKILEEKSRRGVR